MLEAPNYSAPTPAYVPNRPGSSQRNVSTPNSAGSPAAGGSAPWQAPTAPLGQDSRAHTQTQNLQTQQLNQQRHDMAHNLDMGPERLGLDFLLDGTQQINKIPNGINGTQEPANFQQGGRGSDTASPGHQRSNSVSSHGHYSAIPPGIDMTGHAAPIRNGPPTCPLDSLLLDFLHERQQQAADGVATPKLVGPAYPSVSS